jgi:hypothetical protein
MPGVWGVHVVTLLVGSGKCVQVSGTPAVATEGWTEEPASN